MQSNDPEQRAAAERRRRARHHNAVLDAEVARLARELHWVGPQPRQALARLCGSGRWREGGIDAAVSYGTATGRLRSLPFGYVALPEEADE